MRRFTGQQRHVSRQFARKTMSQERTEDRDAYRRADLSTELAHAGRSAKILHGHRILNHEAEKILSGTQTNAGESESPREITLRGIRTDHRQAQHTEQQQNSATDHE